MKTKLDYFSRHFVARTILFFNLFWGVISRNIGDVRLVDSDGGTGSNEGRVEIYSDAGRRQMAWARLCHDDRWNLNVASVVCRQLGFDDVDSWYSSPYSGAGTQRVIRLDRCSRNTDAATLNDAGCRIMNGGRNCNTEPDAGVSCLTLPRTPIPPLDNKNDPTSVVVIATDRQTTSHQMTSTHLISATRMMSTSSGKSTTSPSTTTNVNTVTGDGMTTDTTAIQIPRKSRRNIAAIYSGVSVIFFIIALIVIIIYLRHWCKGKSTTTMRSQQGSDGHENNIPDNEYQYTAVGTGENGQTEPRIPSSNTVDEYQYSPIGPSLDKNEDDKARVPTQESIDEYEYSAVGPIQSGTENEARIPKQESIGEYQYSAVGPIYSDADVEPRVPKQDSVDEYQYSAVGPIQNSSDVEPRFPREDSGDESFYAPVGATSGDTLTPKSTAFANVCTDESMYTIPDTSQVNPYQKLTVTTSTFAGLQKLKKKPVLEQNAPSVPEGNMAKHPPGKPKKPIRKPVAGDGLAQKPAIPHQPKELDNAVYGLEMIGTSSAAGGHSVDQHESIYANDIELQQLSPSITSSTHHPSKDSIMEGKVIKCGENPYENSIIGDESFLPEVEDVTYHALSRKATLPV